MLGRLLIAVVLLRTALIPAGPLHAASASLTAYASSPLLIGEAAWAGSSMSTADEWLEIWNTSDEPIALAGYVLRGASTEPIVFDDTHVIAPRSAFLVANYSAEDQKSSLANEPGLVTTALALSNSSLMIELVAPDGTVIDVAGDGAAPPAGGSSPRASMIRSETGWTTASATSGLDEGIADFGTPGLCDGCNPTTSNEPAEPMPMTTDVKEEEMATSTTITTAIEEPVSPEEESVEEQTPAEIETAINEPSAEETNDAQTMAVAQTAPEPGPQFPAVRLRISGSMVAGEPVTFNAASSTDPNGDIVYFAWNFSDGHSATSSIVTHHFAEPGSYAFELVASDTTFRSFATGTLEISEPPAPPFPLRLNEVHPAPDSGSEWIEISGLPDGGLSPLVGWYLKDSSGTIARISSSTLETLGVQNGLVILGLASAKLNNGGDQVLLFDPQGRLVDGLEYGKTERGQSWCLLDGLWVDCPPTPGEANVKALPEAPAAPEPVIETVQVAFAATGSGVGPAVAQARARIETASEPRQEESPSIKPKKDAQSTKTATAKAPTTTKKTSAKAAPKAAAKTPVSVGVPIDMITPELAGVRVTLEGIVATKPGILSKHHFVLVTNEGIGLYVRGTSRQPSPAMGSRIQVSGELSVNDDGIQLKMGTKDSWNTTVGETSATPRTVDLLDPRIEDGWSLLEASGTVMEVKGTSALVDLNNVPVEVRFRPVVGYRAARLHVGDRVRVRGLLDLRNNEIGLYPRSPEDVEVLEYAKLAKVSAAPKNTLPDWTPFGAAGLTVAVSEGWKRHRNWRKTKQVEKLVRAGNTYGS